MAEIGATPVDDGTGDPQTFKYDLFSLQSKAPELGGRKLQDVYGRGELPSFQWVQAVKSGERTYTDTSAADRARLEKARKDWIEAGGEGSGMPDPAQIIAELSPIVAQVAEGVTSSLAAGGTALEGLPFSGTGSLDIATGTTGFGNLKGLNAAQITNLNAAGMTGAGNIDTTKAIEALGGGKTAPQLAAGKQALKAGKGVEGTSLMLDPATGERLGFSELINPTTEGGFQNLKGAAGGALGNFAVQLALGQDPVKAAKSAGAGAIGKFLGTAIGGPIGGFIGGALGSILGGRVICNELMRQGLLTRKEVILDYRFTRDHLTPTHVNGYHVWAVWMVKQMRKGRLVNFWKHVAGHRANEIAYIYGERDTPDYLGKVYRKILEPTCWVIGSFCKVTDWSVLYKQKEI